MKRLKTEFNDVTSEIRSLSKRLNQRLVRAERAGTQVTGEYINIKSFLEDFSEIKTKGESPRFKEGLQKNLEPEKAKQIVTQMRILEKQSKKIAGKKAKKYAKDIKGITERFEKSEHDLDEKEIKNFFDFATSKSYKSLKRLLDSNQIVEIVQHASLNTAGQNLDELISNVLDRFSGVEYSLNDLVNSIYDEIDEKY